MNREATTNGRQASLRAAMLAAACLLGWMPPAIAAADDDGKAPESLPPSTVSPAIERFLKATGRDRLEPSTALPKRDDARRPIPAIDDAPRQPLRPAGKLRDRLKIAEAGTMPTDRRFPINLATALRLADARPLVIAAAQAGAWVAEAELTRAKVLWMPTVMLGFDYLRHDGGGPDFNKGIMTAPSVNYFMAGGAANLYVNLTDAYFEPLVALQVLNSRHWDIQTAKNDALVTTADAYFRVHQYRGTCGGALYAVERAKELVRRIEVLSTDLVPRVEVDRARNVLADLEQRVISAREEWRVASADLTQVLRLDPRAVVVPAEHDHAQITLIDPARPLDELLAVALTNRPEIESRRSLVQAAEERVAREKARPILPSIIVSGFQTPGMLLQGGVFGLGPNSSLSQYRGREDVSFQLMWQLEGMGIGNLARVKQQRGRQSGALVDLRDQQDKVAAEVHQSLARVQSAAARLLQADRSLRAGIITFRGHLEGLGETRRLGSVLVLTFRPQEAVYSLQQLNVSFNAYFRSVADYNRAQFQLFHALGFPAREVAVLREPGALQPIDTNRPNYLPKVGEGPPAATR